MKTFLINILFLLYSIASMLILGWAMLFPFGIGMKGFDEVSWTGWITYPLALIIGASQGQVFNYFNKHNVLG